MWIIYSIPILSIILFVTSVILITYYFKKRKINNEKTIYLALGISFLIISLFIMIFFLALCYVVIGG